MTVNDMAGKELQPFTPDLAVLGKALEKNRYAVRIFETKEAARDYLVSSMHGLTIGFGDSATLDEMELEKYLSAENIVFNPKNGVDNDDFLRIATQCLTTEIFLSSVNGITQDGVIVNLDGTGNRVAGSLFGHQKVYYVIGRNKIAPDLEQAVWRVRNIAAPKNAFRLRQKTPCAMRGGDKCYNCASPERICNALLIQLKAMNDIETEVVLIDEDLGF